MTQLQQASDLLRRGDLQPAEKLYRAVLGSEPGNGHALWGLGQIALQLKHYDAALGMLAQAASVLPNKPELLLQLAQLLERRGRYSEAGSAYRMAVHAAPTSARVHCALGAYLMGAGEPVAAEAQLREALRLTPGYAPAWLSLSRLKTFEPEDADIDVIQRALPNTGGEAMFLHYAMAKARHDSGDRAAAFEHWRQANELDLTRANFRVDDMRPFFQSLLSQAVGPDLPAAPPARASLTPIFIVGQPRSGSTLLEEMLACHSEINSAGERHYLGEEVASALHKVTGRHFPEAVAELRPEQCGELATLYLECLQRHAPGARMIIDKLPANYQSVGLIQRLMPHARVIHLRRHPMALGFSIFRSHFEAAEPYFCTLPEIGAYHCQYEEVMAHWRRQLPHFVYELRYEDLVEKPQQLLSGVLAFCGLDWEPTCLDFQHSRRHVDTLSQIQVRQGLSATSGEAWRLYGKELQPLRRELGVWVDRYEGLGS